MDNTDNFLVAHTHGAHTTCCTAHRPIKAFGKKKEKAIVMVWMYKVQQRIPLVSHENQIRNRLKRHLSLWFFAVVYDSFCGPGI